MAHLISTACNKCGACLGECPTGSILEGKDHFVIDADTCADHRACVNVCPVNAISPRVIGSIARKHEEEEEET